MKKFKSMMKKAKALIAAAAVAVTTAVCSVCASAETGEAASDMSAIISSAGEQITASFSDMTANIVPVITGIMIGGLGIYAIMMLIKLAKKIFNLSLIHI